MISYPTKRVVSLLSRRCPRASIEFTAMASHGHDEPSASTATHQNREEFSHSAEDGGTSKLRVRGKDDSKPRGDVGNSGGWGGRGDQRYRGDRGNWGARGRDGPNKKKEVGRAEWSYVNETASSLPFELIYQAAMQLIEKHATASKPQNDRN